MPQKSALSGNNAVKNDEAQVRVTSARSFYRHVQNAKIQQISLVKADSSDELFSKEHEACCRATD